MKKYVKRNGLALAGALVCVLGSTVAAVVLQFVKGDVLDAAIAGDFSGTFRYAALLLSLILAEISLFYGFRRLGARFAVSCTRRLKADIFGSILGRSYVAFRAVPQGEYLAKYTNEADMIRDRLFQMLPALCEILLKVLLVSASLFWLDVRIAVVTLVLLTTPLYVPRLIQGRLQAAQTAYVKAVEDGLSRVTDWLSGFEIIKNFAIERRIMERFEHVNGGTMDALLRDKQLGNAAQLLTTLISYLSHFIILVFAAYLVLQGKFSAGSFFVAVGLIDQLSYPLIALSGMLRQIVAVQPTCRSVEAFIEAPQQAQGLPSPTSFRQAIRFEDVSFAYEGKEPLLRHFDLTIEKGKRYLIEGPSGCGKTTAINLLLRYFDAADGRITIDGSPIRQYSSTYGLVTVVRQDATLFGDTLRNNLTMYQEGIPDATLCSLLTKLGLGKFATAEALDSPIAEQGANFSGGEKKRICLARALLRDTGVLILDEPLANLDSDTAARVGALLLGITGRTVVIVSHQFSQEGRKGFDGIVSMGGRPPAADGRDS